MLVLCSVELPGSTAQSDLQAQNRTSAIRQPQSKLDFILRLSIYLRFVQLKLLPRRRASFLPWLRRQCSPNLPAGIPLGREQACCQTHRSARFLYPQRREHEISPILLLPFYRDWYGMAFSVNPVPLASTVNAFVTSACKAHTTDSVNCGLWPSIPWQRNCR